MTPVAVFTLPLDACKPQNRTNHRQPWAYQADRKRVAVLMGLQARRQAAPLPGRPRVVCTRYSSTEADAFSDWAKMAVDVLTMPTARAPMRLGLLRDDRPKDAEIVQRWEYAPPKKGKCVIEVFADETTTSVVGDASVDQRVAAESSRTRGTPDLVATAENEEESR